MPTSPEQRANVLRGMALAALLSGAFISTGYWLLLRTQWFQPVTYGKAAAFSLALASLPLMLGIAHAARIRHAVQDIDGADPAPGTLLHIIRRYVQNTLEQTVLFAVAGISFFFTAPEFSAKLLPVMAVWFCIARALFWRGYVSPDPTRRAVGFAATFHPTILLLLTSIALSLRNGIV
ncbi:MAG: MAPEG family protein [Pseudomonadota bacterium]